MDRMEGYIDVTDEIFASLSHITGAKVVQSPYFDLLEGARAIEVCNPKLDTGMIPLTKNDVEFNCYTALDERATIGVINKLIKVVMSWLDHSSLPVTVLSCRYVQEILTQYLPSGKLIEFDNNGLGKVLSIAIHGVCKFVGIMITVANTVLYEEEDITTRSLDMNFLNEVLIDDIIESLEYAIKLVGTLVKNNEFKQILIHQLNLILNMVRLPILFNLQIELFQGNPYEFFNMILMEGLKSVKFLSTIDFAPYEGEIPQGSFSKYNQTTLNNQHIPGELYVMSQSSMIKELTGVFQQINDILTKSTSLKNFPEFENFLNFDIQLQVNTFHIITRGFFQLYLIRDDQSILGSPTFKLSHLTLEMMNNCNLFNTVHMTKNWNVPAQDVNNIEFELEKILRDIDAITYQLMTIKSNNRCRQRQLINKNLLILDSIQVTCENFEVLIFKNFTINDKLNDKDDLSLPLTSFIYFKKLELMVDYLFIGIELDLYKYFEIYAVYWYLNNLLELLMNQLTSRILNFNQYKLTRLNIKRKKLKNKGDIDLKRERLLEIIKFNEYQLNYYTLLHKLTNAVMKSLQYYHHSGKYDFTQVPPGFLVNFEQIFKLRFKSFESIGVPKKLTFEDYVASLTSSNPSWEEIIKDFESIKADFNLDRFKHHDHQNQWINSLIKSSVMYILQLHRPSALAINEGYNPYFPKLA